MSKYKTANTNKYIDKNKSQTIEKQLKPDSIGDNYFQKVISSPTFKKRGSVQKGGEDFLSLIRNAIKTFVESGGNDVAKLTESIAPYLNDIGETLSNAGRGGLSLVNRGAYHGVDALEAMKLLNSSKADRARFGILSAAAEEGLPTDELRRKAFEDLKRLYSKKFPNNRWDALRRDPSGESFNDPFFRSPKLMTDENHPIHLQRRLYTEGRNRLGTGLGLGLGLGGGAALAAQGFNNEQENGYEMPGSNKSMLKGNTKKRGSVQKGDYASGLFNDGNGSEIQYDGQKKPSKIHYDGQRMPIKNQYDRQEMPSSILSQVMPQIGPNILSQVMPKNGSNILSQVMPKNESNILSQVMPENWSNIANQYMPEKMIELLSELGLLSNGSNNGGINPTGIRYSFADRRKKLQDSVNEEGDGQQIRNPRMRPRNLRQTIPARDIHNGFTGDEYRQLLDHIIPGAGAQYENATAKELSELLGNMNDYPSITNAVKGFTLKRAVKKRGSVRKGDYASGLFNDGNGSGVRRDSYDDYKITPEFRPDQRRDAPFVTPQRPSGFGFESMPGNEIYRYPMGYGLKNEGEIGGVAQGYNPAENAVRQSMPSYWDISEDTQGNTNEELMEALKAYAGKTFNNTKPFLDASLFNGDAWNRNFTKPLTDSFYSNIVDPIDAWLRTNSMKEGKPRNNINDPSNPNLGKRMSKRMHKRMDEDMAVTPRKVSTNRSIKSSNKYFK